MDASPSNTNLSLPSPCPYLALPLPICRWAEMTGKSPFAQVLHATGSGDGLRRVSRAWSLTQGDRPIILVCQIMLHNIFWVFATGGDSEFVQRRGGERRHNYVIITLVVQKKEQGSIKRRQRRRCYKVFILPTDLHKAEKTRIGTQWAPIQNDRTWFLAN